MQHSMINCCLTAIVKMRLSIFERGRTLTGAPLNRIHQTAHKFLSRDFRHDALKCFQEAPDVNYLNVNHLIRVLIKEDSQLTVSICLHCSSEPFSALLKKEFYPRIRKKNKACFHSDLIFPTNETHMWNANKHVGLWPSFPNHFRKHLSLSKSRFGTKKQCSCS